MLVHKQLHLAAPTNLDRRIIYSLETGHIAVCTSPSLLQVYSSALDRLVAIYRFKSPVESLCTFDYDEENPYNLVPPILVATKNGIIFRLELSSNSTTHSNSSKENQEIDEYRLVSEGNNIIGVKRKASQQDILSHLAKRAKLSNISIAELNLIIPKTTPSFKSNYRDPKFIMSTPCGILIVESHKSSFDLYSSTWKVRRRGFFEDLETSDVGLASAILQICPVEKDSVTMDFIRNVFGAEAESASRPILVRGSDKGFIHFSLMSKKKSYNCTTHLLYHLKEEKIVALFSPVLKFDKERKQILMAVGSKGTVLLLGSNELSQQRQLSLGCPVHRCLWHEDMVIYLSRGSVFTVSVDTSNSFESLKFKQVNRIAKFSNIVDIAFDSASKMIITVSRSGIVSAIKPTQREVISEDKRANNQMSIALNRLSQLSLKQEIMMKQMSDCNSTLRELNSALRFAFSLINGKGLRCSLFPATLPRQGVALPQAVIQAVFVWSGKKLDVSNAWSCVFVMKHGSDVRVLTYPLAALLSSDSETSAVDLGIDSMAHSKDALEVTAFLTFQVPSSVQPSQEPVTIIRPQDAPSGAIFRIAGPVQFNHLDFFSPSDLPLSIRPSPVVAQGTVSFTHTIRDFVATFNKGKVDTSIQPLTTFTIAVQRSLFLDNEMTPLQQLLPLQTARGHISAAVSRLQGVTLWNETFVIQVSMSQVSIPVRGGTELLRSVSAEKVDIPVVNITVQCPENLRPILRSAILHKFLELRCTNISDSQRTAMSAMAIDLASKFTIPLQQLLQSLLALKDGLNALFSTHSRSSGDNLSFVRNQLKIAQELLHIYKTERVVNFVV